MTGDRAKRMVDAPSFLDALKILFECGYDENIINERPHRIDELLISEQRRLIKFFSDLCTDGVLLEIILKTYDYHNAKVYFKSRHGEVDITSAGYPFGKLTERDFLEGVKDARSAQLYKEMTAAVETLIKKEDEGTVSPRDIDVVFDVALYKDIAPLFNKVKDKTVRDYFRAECDVKNIIAMLRMKNLGFDAAAAKEQLIAGGKLGGERLLKLLTAGGADVAKEFFGTDYLQLIKLSVKDGGEAVNIADFEAHCAAYILNIITKQKNNLFKMTPLFWYYVQKLEELKTVKYILVCKNNGIEKEKIRQRLKGIYAK